MNNYREVILIWLGQRPKALYPLTGIEMNLAKDIVDKLSDQEIAALYLAIIAERSDNSTQTLKSGFQVAIDLLRSEVALEFAQNTDSHDLGFSEGWANWLQSQKEKS